MLPDPKLESRATQGIRDSAHPFRAPSAYLLLCMQYVMQKAKTRLVAATHKPTCARPFPGVHSHTQAHTLCHYTLGKFRLSTPCWWAQTSKYKSPIEEL